MSVLSVVKIHNIIAEKLFHGTAGKNFYFSLFFVYFLFHCINMVYFIELPDNIVVNIVFLWLKLEQLCCLDSAYCNQKSRKMFLQIFAESPVGLHTEPEEQTSIPHCPRLEWIYHRNVPIANFTISDGIDENNCNSNMLMEGIPRLITSNAYRNLTTIQFSYCPVVCDGSILALIECANGNDRLSDRLRILRLEGCKTITTGMLIQLFQSFKKLEEINVCQCNVTDKVCHAIGSTCLLRLKIISIATCHKVTDVGIMEICELCPNVCELDLSFILNMTRKSLVHVMKKLQHLQRFECSQTYPTKGVRFMQFMLHMFNEIHHIDFIFNSIRGCGRKTQFPDLSSAICSSQWQLSEYFVTLVKERTVSVKCIETIHISSVGSFEFYCIFGQSTLKSLHIESNIMYNMGHSLYDVSVMSLLLNATNLKEITLLKCYYLTDATLIAIAMSCKQLTVFKLDMLVPPRVDVDINDPGLCAIADHCTALHHLELMGCRSISDNSMRRIANNCLRLEVLKVYDCPKLSLECLQLFEARCHFAKTIVWRCNETLK